MYLLFMQKLECLNLRNFFYFLFYGSESIEKMIEVESWFSEVFVGLEFAQYIFCKSIFLRKNIASEHLMKILSIFILVISSTSFERYYYRMDSKYIQFPKAGRSGSCNCYICIFKDFSKSFLSKKIMYYSIGKFFKSLSKVSILLS